MSQTPTDFEARVLELDAERYRLMEAGDAAGLAPLLDEELLYTHSSGHSDSRSQYLSALERGDFVYSGVRHQVDSTIVAGPMVVIRGKLTADAVIHGEEKRLRGAIIAVWRDAEDGPRLVSLQSTTLPASDSEIVK